MMKRSAIVCLLMCSLSAAGSAWAQDEPTDAEVSVAGGEEEALTQRIATLEAQLQELQASVDASNSQEAIDELREELAATQVAAEDMNSAVWGELARRVLFAGHTDLYLQWNEKEEAIPYFRAHQINLYILAQIASNFRFYGELEIEDAAKVGADPAAGGEFKVEQGFVEWTIADWLVIQSGVLINPFGAYNHQHEAWRWAFSGRPIINEIGLPSTFHDAGFGILGTLFETEGGTRASYEFNVTNGLTAGFLDSIRRYRNSSRGLRSARPKYLKDNNKDKGYSLSLSLDVGDTATFGVSGLYNVYSDQAKQDDPDDTNDAIWMAGADLQLRLPAGFAVRSEGLAIHIDAPAGKKSKSLDLNDDGTPDTQMAYPEWVYGAVLEVEWQFFFDGLKETFLGEFPDPKFFVATRFDYFAQKLQEDDPNGIGTIDTTKATVAIGYRPFRSAVYRLQFAQGFQSSKFTEYDEADPNENGSTLDVGNEWEVRFGVALGF